ncbi:hypothetical protein TWF730_008651 [Orbilia blumenaviensis]|uniref:Uncharacterized protein n=1 Tax=Orbilia blumenaviensis TaxID=1796055 RepID=A0AAV9V3P2_9PEZI
MHLTNSISAAVAFLSCASGIYGHGLIVDAYGNSNAKARGRGVGFVDQYAHNRKGTGQHPFQVDVPVFKDPAVPCCKRKRTYLAQGCGITLQVLWRNKIKPNGHLIKQSWYSGAVQHIFTSNNGGQVNLPYEMNLLMSKKLMPQASAGGWLKMRIHQVNVDGGGPYKCRIDSTGTANRFGAWIHPTINVPGDKYSLSWKTIHKPNLWIHLPIPKGTQCTGKWGSYTRVCMVRCENQAVNGPFGGCVPFQQIGGIIKTAPKPLTPIVKITAPPTITVTQEAPTVTITADARPPTKEEIDIAVGGEDIPKEAIEEIKEEKVIEEKDTELDEAKDENEKAADKAENEPPAEDYDGY